jgi:hypothetical protein
MSLRGRSVPAQLAARMTCFDPATSHDEDRWFAVWSIALGSFVLVFSEVIPVGLLPDVSRGFGVSIGLAGLMVVVPAVTAALTALAAAWPDMWQCRGRCAVTAHRASAARDAPIATAVCRIPGAGCAHGSARTHPPVGTRRLRVARI